MCFFAQRVRTRIEVVPLWADPNKVHQIPRRSERAPTVLYSDSLGQKQGVGQLLDSAAELDLRRPEIRVVIRGAGSQQCVLKTCIRAAQSSYCKIQYGAG